MTVLHIKRAGADVDGQDLGRTGLMHLGVSGAGAMDLMSMLIGNRLVGNADRAATLEFAHVGGAFEVETPVRFRPVTGGAVDITVDGEARHGWESHWLMPGRS